MVFSKQVGQQLDLFTIRMDGTGLQRLTNTAEGLRWVRRNAPVRTLALVILVFNITWGAGWSVLVLYPLDHLHMGELGLGLLTGLARAHPDRPRRHLRRDFAVSGKGARHGDIWVSMSVAHSGPG